MSGSDAVLSVRGLGKSYAAPVLDGVDLELAGGEVLALVGENGAGKSTLAQIIAGLVVPATGSMCLAGDDYRPANRPAAERAGVQIVLQELNVIPTLTIAENLFLHRLPRRAGVIRRGELRTRAREAMARVGLDRLSPDTLVGELGLGLQQMVEIARNLVDPCRVLILDEPTAMLTAREVDLLFVQVRRLKAEGVAVVFVSHRLEELAVIADRIAVLRGGRLVAIGPMANYSFGELVRLMAGRDLAEGPQRAVRTAGPPGLRLRDLTRGRAVRGVSLEVGRGEIVGLAGLVGSGRTELLRLIFGADHAESGEVWVGDPLRKVEIRFPWDAVAAGIALVTEDRKSEGLLAGEGVAANIALGNLAGISRPTPLGRAVNRTREHAMAARHVGALGIRCASTGQPVGELSGGNQQKVLLARWLEHDAAVYLLDEPSRGVDPAARADIHALMTGLAERGKALLVVSSDLRELMALCDRIAVLSKGRLVQVFDRDSWSADAILGAAFCPEDREDGAA
ncbi:MAG TPA: sugar ABC transporter ATP-binding protein [Candidatus Didemnitutus sp.]|jgi:ribose transport system ATP-binding protein